MSLDRLSGDAEICLKAFNLPDDGFQQVKYCIIHYTKPTGFFNSLQYIAFRVWNAIKSLFGYSAWQQSNAVIKNAFFNKGKDILSQFNLGKRNESIFLRELDSTVNMMAKRLLEYCLEVNDLNIGLNPTNTIEDIVQEFARACQKICEKCPKAS